MNFKKTYCYIEMSDSALKNLFFFFFILPKNFYCVFTLQYLNLKKCNKPNSQLVIASAFLKLFVQLYMNKK